MTIKEMAHEAVTRWKNGEFRSADHEEVYHWGFTMEDGETAQLYELVDDGLALVVTLDDGTLEMSVSDRDGEGAVIDIETGKTLAIW